MPNRKQIIIFSVLGITALLIGYFKNPLNLSMGKRAEAGGPIVPTRTLTLEEKKIVGTYERISGADIKRLVFLANSTMEYYKNGEKQNTDFKWSIVDNEIHVEYPLHPVQVYRSNPDNSTTRIASIRDGKREDRPKEYQPTWKKIN